MSLVNGFNSESFTGLRDVITPAIACCDGHTPVMAVENTLDAGM